MKWLFFVKTPGCDHNPEYCECFFVRCEPEGLWSIPCGYEVVPCKAYNRYQIALVWAWNNIKYGVDHCFTGSFLNWIRTDGLHIVRKFFEIISEPQFEPPWRIFRWDLRPGWFARLVRNFKL